MDDVPVFRALKRRKTAAKSVTRRSDSISDEESVPALSGIRNQLKPRHQGVQFSNSIPASRGQDDEASRDLVFGGEHELNAQAGGLLSRFVGSGSGSQIENVDKHMIDYIDRAMAEKQRTSSATSVHATEEDDYTDASRADNDPPTFSRNPPASGGKPQTEQQKPANRLVEVDLPPGSSHRQQSEEQQPKRPRRRKARLGRDGKPLRPRPRKGPNPDDIARNTLVEQVLHEHGLGTYDKPQVTARKGGTGRGDDEAADERMAAEFQQQFLDAMAERQQRQPQPSSKTAGTTSTAAGSSGPRLGGSRSARAKMAAMQAQAQVQGGEKEK